MKIKPANTIVAAQELLNTARELNEKGVQAVVAFEGQDVGINISQRMVRELIRETQRKLNRLKG